jgi:hypothetical protein
LWVAAPSASVMGAAALRRSTRKLSKRNRL